MIHELLKHHWRVSNMILVCVKHNPALQHPLLPRKINHCLMWHQETHKYFMMASEGLQKITQLKAFIVIKRFGKMA